MNAKWAWYGWFFLSIPVSMGQAWADCGDHGLPKAIGIEEPWLENAGYLLARSPAGNGAGFSVATAADIRLSRRLGMEIDMPSWRPQGIPRSSDTLGAGLKVPLTPDCRAGRPSHTLVTAEIEGQYSHRAAAMANGPDSSITAQVEWAQDAATFTQGEIGYTQTRGPNLASGWFLNTSVGRYLGKTTALQLEIAIDNQNIGAGGHRDLKGSVLPQIAFRVAPDWLFALGEQVAWAQNRHKTQRSTWFMAEREFD
ncbi:MAG: hypothetical protein ACYDEV_16680 [Acidiferrobacter sp.]